MIFQPDKTIRWYPVWRNGKWWVADGWLNDTYVAGPLCSLEACEERIAELREQQIREMGS